MILGPIGCKESLISIIMILRICFHSQFSVVEGEEFLRRESRFKNQVIEMHDDYVAAYQLVTLSPIALMW